MGCAMALAAIAIPASLGGSGFCLPWHDDPQGERDRK
jgi:hypothetical protein